MDNVDKFTDTQLRALDRIEKDKSQVARTYNKKVKEKSFQVNNLVRKTILSLEIKKYSLCSKLEGILAFLCTWLLL